MAIVHAPRAAGVDFAKAVERMRRAASFEKLPSLGHAGTSALEAWFLGAKGENGDLLEQLVVEAVRDHVHWRRNYQPTDPGHITEHMRRSPEYTETLGVFLDEYRSLLAFLKKSVPFFSMRYQGHMIWDLTLPAIAGYFAAMLYNPNNVSFEASPTTSVLEMLAGDDLCRMLGYRIPTPEEQEAGIPRPWGHITCDGTVANIEALWSARNLKFYPAALKQALLKEDALFGAREIEVELPQGGARKKLVEMDGWSLLNIRTDDALALPSRLEREYGISLDAQEKALAAYQLQSLGFYRFSREVLADLEHAPVFLVPGTKHYSLPKAAALLGIGASNLLDVCVDLDARMDMTHLRALLERCLDERRPVITVVAVMGSTEESAVDPLQDILDLRDELRKRGLEFTVHADAAWGGYHASVLREGDGDDQMPDPLSGASEVGQSSSSSESMVMNAHVRRHFEALRGADSITVDPHKSGYIPYPAGALCYRSSAMRDLCTFKAPYMYRGDFEPNVGIYGVEGSKPGAAAAAVYMSHRVIRPNRQGYGKIIGQALASCKKLYARLLDMSGQGRMRVVPLPRLPAEREGLGEEAIEAQIALIRERIVRRSDDQILGDEEALFLFREMGPDQNILAYAFNYVDADGKLNTSLEKANELCERMYELLSPHEGSDIYGYRLIVSTTTIEKAHYGDAFVEDFKRRLGVGGSEGDEIRFLRSTVMDPWVTETTRGSFLDVIEEELRAAFDVALEALEVG